ncbi:hypothetical protein Tco_0833302 [Tanacetum coccineum]
MLSLRLVVGTASEDAYTLLRFIQKQIDEYGSHDGAHQECKELASPKKTALGKDISNSLIVDSLLKIIWLSMHHVICNEALAIPEQTVYRCFKEISNPFMAGSLPKTIKPT